MQLDNHNANFVRRSCVIGYTLRVEPCAHVPDYDVLDDAVSNVICLYLICAESSQVTTDFFPDLSVCVSLTLNCSISV